MTIQKRSEKAASKLLAPCSAISLGVLVFVTASPAFPSTRAISPAAASPATTPANPAVGVRDMLAARGLRIADIAVIEDYGVAAGEDAGPGPSIVPPIETALELTLAREPTTGVFAAKGTATVLSLRFDRLGRLVAFNSGTTSMTGRWKHYRNEVELQASLSRGLVVELEAMCMEYALGVRSPSGKLELSVLDEGDYFYVEKRVTPAAGVERAAAAAIATALSAPRIELIDIRSARPLAPTAATSAVELVFYKVHAGRAEQSIVHLELTNTGELRSASVLSGPSRGVHMRLAKGFTARLKKLAKAGELQRITGAFATDNAELSLTLVLKGGVLHVRQHMFRGGDLECAC